MARDVQNTLSGPASVTLATTEIGHTQGGVKFSIAPQTRGRVVDEFGSTAMDMIHTGDECRLTVPWCEWTAATLAEIYGAGSDQTAAVGAKYMGIGRSAGFIYTSQAAEIVPLLTAAAAKKISLNRVVPIGTIELNFTADEDRIFNTEFAGLGDDTATNGELIGKIHLAAA